MRGRSLQQLVTFFKLEVPDRQVPEERVRVDARAMDVEDVLEGVKHVLDGIHADLMISPMISEHISETSLQVIAFLRA